MELANIPSRHISLLNYRRCKTKKTKDLDERLLKRRSCRTNKYWSYDEKILLDDSKRCLSIWVYEWLDLKKFEETKLPPKNAF